MQQMPFGFNHPVTKALSRIAHYREKPPSEFEMEWLFHWFAPEGKNPGNDPFYWQVYEHQMRDLGLVTQNSDVPGGKEAACPERCNAIAEIIWANEGHLEPCLENLLRLIGIEPEASV